MKSPIWWRDKPSTKGFIKFKKLSKINKFLTIDSDKIQKPRRKRNRITIGFAFEFFCERIGRDSKPFTWERRQNDLFIFFRINWSKFFPFFKESIMMWDIFFFQIKTSLDDFIKKIKNFTTENVFPVTYHPQSLYFVKPITRSTSSLPGLYLFKFLLKLFV